jgi:ABC-type Mn2+/Zn2+ transport system permease subunit
MVLEITDHWWENVGRFLSLRDPFVRAAVLGAVLLGINCGVLGTFLVVRRMALVGDTLAHAVLPGVVGGYMWNYSKDPAAMLLGAVVAGVLGSALMHAITASTKIKADAAQGLVLTSFFAIGVCMIAMLPPGNKGGVDKFLFGQLAAVSAQDLWWLGKSTVFTLLFTGLAYRGLLVLSFDEGFGRLCGLPVRWLHYLLMLLTTLAIVVAMESVGVVLVSALLVIPSSAASLMTRRLHRLMVPWWCSVRRGFLP